MYDMKNLKMTDHQRAVAKALQGNHGVWFHPWENKVAVWYGESKVRIFDSESWEEVNDHSINAAYKDVPYDHIESAVDVVLAELGYHRDKDQTTLDVDNLYALNRDQQELDI